MPCSVRAGTGVSLCPACLDADGIRGRDLRYDTAPRRTGGPERFDSSVRRNGSGGVDSTIGENGFAACGELWSVLGGSCLVRTVKSTGGTGARPGTSYFRRRGSFLSCLVVVVVVVVGVGVVVRRRESVLYTLVSHPPHLTRCTH